MHSRNYHFRSHLATSVAVIPGPNNLSIIPTEEDIVLDSSDRVLGATKAEILEQMASSECEALWTTGRPLGRFLSFKGRPN